VRTPHLRGKGSPVPAGPPIFDDADTGAVQVMSGSALGGGLFFALLDAVLNNFGAFMRKAPPAPTLSSQSSAPNPQPQTINHKPKSPNPKP